MSAATLTRETMTPALFDLDVETPAVYTDADRKADRALCKSYLGTWADSYGRHGAAKRDQTITFEEFEAAAARLSSAA